MSDNATLIHDLYAAFGRGDLPFILAGLADDVEWTCFGPDALPFTGVFKGPAQVAKFFEALITTQSEQKLTIEETYSDGEQVISVGRYSAVVNATQKRFDSKIAHFFTVRNGKIVRLLDFIDTAEQLAAYSPNSAGANA